MKNNMKLIMESWRKTQKALKEDHGINGSSGHNYEEWEEEEPEPELSLEETIEKVLKQFSPEQVEALENSYRSQIKDPNDPRRGWSLEDAVRHTVENTGATAEELISSLKNQLTRGL